MWRREEGGEGRVHEKESRVMLQGGREGEEYAGHSSPQRDEERSGGRVDRWGLVR